MRLIHDAEAFVSCIRRLHANNDAFLFRSKDGAITYMLRNGDGGTPTTAQCELCIMCDSEDEDMTELLRLEHEGYFEDTTTFLVDEFDIPLDAAAHTSSEVVTAIERLNTVYSYTICLCGRYMIKDGFAVCFHCQLTQNPILIQDTTCCICLEKGSTKCMQVRPCCNQYIHSTCWRKYVRMSPPSLEQPPCPLCRRT